MISEQTKPRIVGIGAVVVAILFLLVRWGPDARGGDFLNFFYPVGKQVLAGHLGYALPRHYTIANVGIYRYPPIAAVLIAPFATFGPATAARVWWCFGVVVMVGTAWACASVSDERSGQLRAFGFWCVALAAFAPLAFSISYTIDIWLVGLTAGAYVLDRRGGPSSKMGAGFLLGLSAALKVYPMLTLLVIVWFRRDEVRMLAAGAGIAIAVSVAVPLILVGWSPFREYAQVLGSQGDPLLAGIPFAFGLLNIATRGLVATPYVIGHLNLGSGTVKLGFVVAAVGILFYVARRLGRREPTTGGVWANALLLTVACSPFLEIQHLAPLALLPCLLTGGTSRLSGAIVLACAVNSLASEVFSSGAVEVLTVVGAVATLGWLWAGGMRHSVPVFAAAFVLLASPAFLNWSASWGVPMTEWQVLFGGAEYAFVIAMVMCCPCGEHAPGRPTSAASRSAVV